MNKNMPQPFTNGTQVAKVDEFIRGRNMERCKVQYATVSSPPGLGSDARAGYMLHAAANGCAIRSANQQVSGQLETESVLRVCPASGDAPVAVAANFGHVDVVAVLLAAGASVEAKNNDGHGLRNGGRSLGPEKLVEELASRVISPEIPNAFNL